MGNYITRNPWVIINLPALGFFIHLLVYPDDWESVIEPTGMIGFILLVLVLSLNPISKIYPKAKVFKAMNRHRRAIGVGVFVYACVHVSSYYAKKGSFAEMAKYFVHPVILPALVAFVLFFILSITSNNFSIKKLKGKRWKKLHKLTYLCEILIFLHMALQGGDTLVWAIIGFLPLFVLQMKRWRMSY